MSSGAKSILEIKDQLWQVNGHFMVIIASILPYSLMVRLFWRLLKQVLNGSGAIVQKRKVMAGPWLLHGHCSKHHTTISFSNGIKLGELLSDSESELTLPSN